LCAAAAAALACVPVAAADDVTLHPAGGDAQTYAAWRAQEGLPDDLGQADQGLYFTSGDFQPGAAAVAIVEGVQERPVTLLFGLEYEYRIDGRCDVFSPRWTIAIRGKSGREYLVRLGCRTGVRRPGSAPGWVRVTHPQKAIRLQILRAGGTDALGGRITELALVFDSKGAAKGAPTFVVLDNILVQLKTGRTQWTFAGDNGVGAALPTGFAALAADQAQELSVSELTPVEELLASITPEEQAALDAADAEPTA
jgi:hypothetical protein